MLDELHVSIIDDAPYVGPSPFEYKHRGIFFGRDREADKLVSLITAHPITLLYAPSGAGKTSLINAKLIPMLKKEGFDVLPPARVQSQAPITIPQDSIKNIFVFNSILDWTKDGGVEQSDVAQKTLAECLAETVRPPQGGAAAAGNGHGEEPARVLIFDQMEEVFTLYPERWKDRQDFFRQIRDAISPRDKSRAGQGGAAVTSPLRVLFVMREDYIAGLDPYVHLL